MRYISRKSQWTRCYKCGYCNYIRWAPTPISEDGEYISTGCRICSYEWTREKFINSLVNRLRMEFKLAQGKEIEWRPDEPVKHTLTLFSTSLPPEVIRECYQVAIAIFTDTYTRMWARSLQSKAQRR
jgi:hypothetical protein